jgi:hypothetical protein
VHRISACLLGSPGPAGVEVTVAFHESRPRSGVAGAGVGAVLGLLGLGSLNVERVVFEQWRWRVSLAGAMLGQPTAVGSGAPVTGHHSHARSSTSDSAASEHLKPLEERVRKILQVPLPTLKV